MEIDDFCITLCDGLSIFVVLMWFVYTYAKWNK